MLRPHGHGEGEKGATCFGLLGFRRGVVVVVGFVVVACCRRHRHRRRRRHHRRRRRRETGGEGGYHRPLGPLHKNIGIPRQSLIVEKLFSTPTLRHVPRHPQQK